MFRVSPIVMLQKQLETTVDTVSLTVPRIILIYTTVHVKVDPNQKSFLESHDLQNMTIPQYIHVLF